MSQADLTCQQCGHVFTRLYDLQRHVTSVHEKRRQYVCEQCDKAFTLKSVLKDHITCVHEPTLSRAVCQLCFKSFKTRRSLARHMRRNHPDSKPSHGTLGKELTMEDGIDIDEGEDALRRMEYDDETLHIHTTAHAVPPPSAKRRKRQQSPEHTPATNESASTLPMVSTAAPVPTASPFPSSSTPNLKGNAGDDDTNSRSSDASSLFMCDTCLNIFHSSLEMQSHSCMATAAATATETVAALVDGAENERKEGANEQCVAPDTVPASFHCTVPAIPSSDARPSSMPPPSSTPSSSSSSPTQAASGKRPLKRPRPSTVYACPYSSISGCAQSFHYKHVLTNHIRAKHTDERPFRCDAEGCDKRFPTLARKVQHQRTHERARELLTEEPKTPIMKRKRARDSMKTEDSQTAEVP